MAETMTSKQTAEALGLEAKTVRVFLQSGNAEGMFTRDGRTYVFASKDVNKLKAAHTRWAKAKADEAAKKAAEAPTLDEEA